MLVSQVHLRLQWVRQVVRGQYMNAEVSLSGLGLIVMGGLQDELFNLTVDRIKARPPRALLHISYIPSSCAASNGFIFDAR